MERRKFIKATCRFCLLGAAGYALPTLLSCNETKTAVYKTPINNKQIEVPLSLFETASLQFVRPKGWFYDIVVQKQGDSFSALLMKCTHMDNQLTLSGEGFHCSLHGSVFNKKGKAEKGPAEVPLTSYKTSVHENNLIINL